MSNMTLKDLSARVQTMQAAGFDCSQWVRQGFLHAHDAFNTGKSNMGTDYDYNYSTTVASTSFLTTPYPSWLTTPATSGALFNTFPQAEPVVITGKQYVVVCNGRVEYCDTKDQAQAAAERLAHANQSDAFILTPTSKVAPKRDVVTTAIKL